MEDDGVGMNAEQIAQLFTVDKHDHSGMGIGVINVNNRIKLCFGEQYGLFTTAGKAKEPEWIF